jgi:hypothetical protein
MHLHPIPPHKVQKSPPLNVQSYTLYTVFHEDLSIYSYYDDKSYTQECSVSHGLYPYDELLHEADTHNSVSSLYARVHRVH